MRYLQLPSYPIAFLLSFSLFLSTLIQALKVWTRFFRTFADRLGFAYAGQDGSRRVLRGLRYASGHISDVLFAEPD